MLSGVMLVVVTTFAVLGAYYLTELLAQGLARHRKMPGAVVVLAPSKGGDVWGDVLDLRDRLPDAHVVVVTAGACNLQGLEPSMKGVVFATADTVGPAVCEQLRIPTGGS